jgi:hypothetical protein
MSWQWCGGESHLTRGYEKRGHAKDAEERGGGEGDYEKQGEEYGKDGEEGGIDGILLSILLLDRGE